MGLKHPGVRTHVPKLGDITAHMQPVIDLSTGRVVGFEALARLQKANELLSPASFLSNLSHTTRVKLFCEMLRQASRFVMSARASHPALFVSVNVETSILMRDDIFDMVEAFKTDGAANEIYLELLESEQIADFDKAATNLTRLKELNFGISLDDFGSAYSSLILLKRLPIDVIKLDQVFARELSRRPADLQFVHSVISLARGLGKKLVVEGIETPEIQGALSLLGVEYGQGYAIAKPMPPERALAWITQYREVQRQKHPSSLLGCYATHLNAIETCRMLALQPLPISWKKDVRDPHACGIGEYFDRFGLHDSPLGLAHKEFHRVFDTYNTDPAGWAHAASRFRDELQTVILAEGLTKLDPASGPMKPSPTGDCVETERSLTVAAPAVGIGAAEPPVGESSAPVDMFLQIAASASDVIIVTTALLNPPHPLIVYVNAAFTRLTGYSAAEVIGQSPRMLQGPATDRATLKVIRNLLSSGQEVHEVVLNFGKGKERYWLDLRIFPLRDGAGTITHFAAIERDVTMNKRRLDELRLAADRDPLTGIPNRRALLRVVETELTAMQLRCVARPDGRDACLAFIDIDRFKNVNDTHGHAAGDAVLLGLADRLTESLRRSDTLGRMGGEEFALWMPGVTLHDAQGLMERVRRLVEEKPFDTHAGPVPITVSVGVTACRPLDNLIQLMHRADTAMYSAKQAGRNRVLAPT